MRSGLYSVAVAFSVSLLACAAQAQLPGPNLAPPPAATFEEQQVPAVAAPQQVIDDRIAFNGTERWMILRYYERVREKQKRAARSKKYERVLPAGLSTDPAKGDLLPVTLLPTLHRLPGPLLRDLPPSRPNTDRVMVGKNVLMVSVATGEVLDILPNILF